MRPATGSVSWSAGAGADASQAAKARSPISGPTDLRSASSLRSWPFVSVVSFTVGGPEIVRVAGQSIKSRGH